MRFEATVAVSAQAKTVHALDRSVTVTGVADNSIYKIQGLIIAMFICKKY
jgi:hypothetical protein